MEKILIISKKNGIKQITNFAIIVKNFSTLIELILKELIKLNLK